MILYDLGNPANRVITCQAKGCTYEVIIETTFRRPRTVLQSKELLLGHWREKHSELFNIALLAGEGYITFGSMHMDLFNSEDAWKMSGIRIKHDPL